MLDELVNTVEQMPIGNITRIILDTSKWLCRRGHIQYDHSSRVASELAHELMAKTTGAASDDDDIGLRLVACAKHSTGKRAETRVYVMENVTRDCHIGRENDGRVEKMTVRWRRCAKVEKMTVSQRRCAKVEEMRQDKDI